MLSPELQSEIRDSLAGLRGTHARLIAQELSARTGVSVRQIYKLTADLRERALRKDAGILRKKPAPETLDVLYRLVAGNGFDAALALRVAVANGLVSPEAAPSAATLRRWMRLDGVGGDDDDRVCRRFEAERPNQIHQADSTVSATFYLDGDGSVGFESPKECYKNKKGNQRPRLILYVLVDDYSRATYAEYFLQENTGTWLQFLWHAWGPKEDPSAFPFEGVPETIYADNGSPLKSPRFTTACVDLGVTPKFHRPHHAQSKGKVERRIGVLQSQFEKLFLLKKPATLAEANELLYRHVRIENMEVHSETGARPFQRWVDRAEAVRRLPAERILKMLGRVRDTRILGPDLTFTLGGERFMAPYIEPFRSMPRGQKVNVLYTPECPFEVLVSVGRTAWAAIHVPKGSALPNSLPAADEAKTRTNEMVARYKAVGLEELDAFAHERAAAAAPSPIFLPQPHVAAPVEREVPDEPLTDVAAMRALQEARVCAKPAEAADTALVAFLFAGQDRIPESRLADLIMRYKGKRAPEILARLIQDEAKDTGHAEAVSSVG